MKDLSNSDDSDAFYGCLASQHGLGYAGFSQLLRGFGSPEAVYAATPVAWRAAWPRLSPAAEASLARGPRVETWRALLEECHRRAIRVTAPGWPGYPQTLLELEAPPPLLYVRGAWKPEDARAVALVGTRAPTAYGRQAAFTIARELAAHGCTVTSGLAVGIDAAAHAGAMADGRRTLAVIGCGLDIAYPRDNLGIRERIEENGAVISEFPPGTPPLSSHFPRRNRLISALSCATVVVEAGGKSGALLTAAHTRNQNKPLFAVPGPIFSSVSEGTNALLRRGALLATSAADVVRALDAPRTETGPRFQAHFQSHIQPQSQRQSRSQAGSGIRKLSSGVRSSPASNAVNPVPVLARKESADPVLRLWAGEEACAVDALTERAIRTNLWPREQAAAALLERLLQLELSGLVRRMPGASYRLA